jgi:hypothetical protein
VDAGSTVFSAEVAAAVTEEPAAGAVAVDVAGPPGRLVRNRTKNAPRIRRASPHRRGDGRLFMVRFTCMALG